MNEELKISPERTFMDKNLGLIGLHPYGEDVWVYQYNQCNDEWVILRKATRDDIEKIDKLFATLKTENLEKQHNDIGKDYMACISENTRLKTELHSQKSDLGKQVVRNLELMADMKAANDTFVGLREQIKLIEKIRDGDNERAQKYLLELTAEVERLKAQLSAQSEKKYTPSLWLKRGGDE